MSEIEHTALEQGLRSKDAFTLRRCQILLASASGTKPREIAAYAGCSVQTVRNTIRAARRECITFCVEKAESKNSQ